MARTPRIRDLKIFHATGARAQHPVAKVSVPDGYKMIGGGARDNWSSAGNLLTASYPSASNTWSAAGKDHDIVSRATLDVWAIAIFDPDDEFEVVIDSVPSNMTAHPSAFVPQREGFQLVGGGARTTPRGAGQLLYASFPAGTAGWQASSKDHVQSAPSVVTAYAISMRPANGAPLIPVMVRSLTTGIAAHPAGACEAPAGCRLIGGGARVNWSGAGNLLTASYPENDTWAARAKDHEISDPASIAIFAMGIGERFFR